MTKKEHVYIRGSKMRFALMPDMLKNAPMFKRFDPKTKDKTVGKLTFSLIAFLCHDTLI